MKKDFMTVATDYALNALNKSGVPCVGAYVLHYLFPDKYPDPAVLQEVAALSAEYRARGERVPSAFVFKAR